MAAPAAVYRPRYPQATDYYRCVEDHLESFIQGYEERFERTYGFFRPYLRKVIYRYLDCGNLRNGFARVKCGDCNHEYLLAFSCKRRHFCPSCHQKRVVEFGEWLCANVLKKVPHRHFVLSIPKILRRYFLYDRRLLHDLSRCAWESLKVFMQEVIPYLIESDISPKACRKSWARLIRKIYEVDPLICPKCQGAMRIISSIEDQEVIKLPKYYGV